MENTSIFYLADLSFSILYLSFLSFARSILYLSFLSFSTSIFYLSFLSFSTSIFYLSFLSFSSSILYLSFLSFARSILYLSFLSFARSILYLSFFVVSLRLVYAQKAASQLQPSAYHYHIPFRLTQISRTELFVPLRFLHLVHFASCLFLAFPLHPLAMAQQRYSQ